MFYCSDILSFYKEHQDGDISSYIHAHSLVTGKTLNVTLYEVIDKVVAAAVRIRRILGDGKARKAWDSFERGYLAFHVEDPRYRLEGILSTMQMTNESTE